MWLKISREGSSDVKFAWGDDGGPYKHYTVDRDALSEAAGRLRAALLTLTAWTKTRRADDLPNVLTEVAGAGAELQFAMFDAPAEDSATVEAVQGWRNRRYLLGDKTLKLIVDPKLHVPWGLAFDEETGEHIDGHGPDAYSGFWCLKYRFSAILAGCETHELANRLRPSTCRLVSLINRDIYNHARQDLDAAEYAEFETLLAGPEAPTFTLGRCKQIASKRERGDKVFHYLGHGEPDSLILGDTDGRVSITAFKMLMKGLAQRVDSEDLSYGLVFLNSCDSALGDGGYSFKYAVTQHRHLCGLIATEAEVPRSLAIDFDRRFLKLITRDGCSVGDAMNTLLRDTKIWPLGLLYGCYANPIFTVAKQN